MKKFVKVFYTIFYIILAIYLLSLFLRKPILSRKESIAFLGFTFLGLGVLGLFEKAILLTKNRPFKYEEDSIVGRNINIFLCIIGIVIMLYGFFALITSN